MPSKIKLKKPAGAILLALAVLTVVLSLIFVFVGNVGFFKNWLALSDPIKQLNASYEPSAVQQLINGDVIVLEDEISRAVSLLTFDDEGNLREDSIRDQRLNAQLTQKFDDLEGITLSRRGEIYATTSFSRTSKGKQRPNREKLLRLTFSDSGEILKQDAYTGFAEALEKSQLFQTLQEIGGDESIAIGDINIEGLSFDKESRQLLFGLKAPLVNDLSVIFYLQNPQQVLDGVAAPIIAESVSLLELYGGGIRSLFFDRKLDGYLIANEVNFGGGPKQSQLWFWSGKTEAAPIALILPTIERMKNIEAISAAKVDGKDSILLMSDDGSRKKKQAAHYALIQYAAIESQISQ